MGLVRRLVGVPGNHDSLQRAIDRRRNRMDEAEILEVEAEAADARDFEVRREEEEKGETVR